MKLVSRVERWRLYLPTQNQTQEDEGEEGEKDAELEHERQAHKNDLDPAWLDPELQHSLRHRREQRDRENLTDFVNGEVAGVGRGRLMCWPVLIERSEWENCWSREESEMIGRWEEPVWELDV